LLPANGILYKFNAKRFVLIKPIFSWAFIFLRSKRFATPALFGEEREEFPQFAEVPPNVEVQHLVSPGTCCSPLLI